MKKSHLKKKNKIYLFIKNLRISRLNWKLDHKKVGLFIIKIKKSNIIFELELSKGIKIYPVFYILFLELADSEISVQNKSLKLLSENEYKIKSIRNYNLKTY